MNAGHSLAAFPQALLQGELFEFACTGELLRSPCTEAKGLSQGRILSKLNSPHPLDSANRLRGLGGEKLRNVIPKLLSFLVVTKTYILAILSHRDPNECSS